MDWVYVPFEVAPDRLGAALDGVRALGIAGVNLTVPLKERALPFLDEVGERARQIGAVNTVVNDDGRLFGDSTDGPGFLSALDAEGIALAGSKAVVLGAGGSARAVVHALASSGARVSIANRTAGRARELADQFARFGTAGPIETVPWTEDALRAALSGAALLVNTTSVGMHPDDDGMPPVPADALFPGLFVFDLIYNPGRTRLLSLALDRGCRVQNGVEMLVWQGALAFRRWTGVDAPPVDVMRGAVEDTLRQRKK
jgi:shikimate dehydrogenase